MAGPPGFEPGTSSSARKHIIHTILRTLIVLCSRKFSHKHCDEKRYGHLWNRRQFFHTQFSMGNWSWHRIMVSNLSQIEFDMVNPSWKIISLYILTLRLDFSMVKRSWHDLWSGDFVNSDSVWLSGVGKGCGVPILSETVTQVKSEHRSNMGSVWLSGCSGLSSEDSTMW